MHPFIFEVLFWVVVIKATRVVNGTCGNDMHMARKKKLFTFYQYIQ